MRRVVVTGLGVLTPLGNNLQEYWEGLKNGVSGSVMITRFDTEKFKTKFACELKNYDSAKYFDRKEANKLDLYSQYALVATDEAIIDSGLNLDKVDSRLLSQPNKKMVKPQYQDARNDDLKQQRSIQYVRAIKYTNRFHI